MSNWSHHYDTTLTITRLTDVFDGASYEPTEATEAGIACVVWPMSASEQIRFASIDAQQVSRCFFDSADLTGAAVTPKDKILIGSRTFEVKQAPVWPHVNGDVVELILEERV